MYQSLHALDIELRREQALAACEQPLSTQLQARSKDESNTGDSGSVGVGSASTGAPLTTNSSSGLGNAIADANFSRSASLRKASGVSSKDPGGGNGATAPNVRAGSDNDIVARRLRKAAEQETDPTLRAKLWKEYKDYLQGASAR
jgi:hypothetical protein